MMPNTGSTVDLAPCVDRLAFRRLQPVAHPYHRTGRGGGHLAGLGIRLAAIRGVPLLCLTAFNSPRYTRNPKTPSRFVARVRWNGRLGEYVKRTIWHGVLLTLFPLHRLKNINNQCRELWLQQYEMRQAALSLESEFAQLGFEQAGQLHP